MTNQQITKYSDWIAWWKTNQNKTQVEWIREGFSQKGIVLNNPLTTNSIILLLHASTNRFLRYNAQHWLRDSGFDPVKFDLHSVPAEEREVITQRLIAFALWLGEHRQDPGRLAINDRSITDYWRVSDDLKIEQPPYKWLPHLLVIALISGGLYCLRTAARRKHSNQNVVPPVS